MLTKSQIETALAHINVRSFSQEIGVSEYLVRKMRDGQSGTVPYLALKKVCDYFGGDEDEMVQA